MLCILLKQNNTIVLFSNMCWTFGVVMLLKCFSNSSDNDLNIFRNIVRILMTGVYASFELNPEILTSRILPPGLCMSFLVSLLRIAEFVCRCYVKSNSVFFYTSLHTPVLCRICDIQNGSHRFGKAGIAS